MRACERVVKLEIEGRAYIYHGLDKIYQKIIFAYFTGIYRRVEKSGNTGPSV